MNVSILKNTLQQKLGRGGLYLSKYSPSILLGAGIAGGVVAAVMAARATTKLDGIVQETKEALEALESSVQEFTEEHDELSGTEVRDILIRAKAKVYVMSGLEIAKLYGPSVGVGILSIASILYSHGIMAKRQAALAAGLTLAGEIFQSYRDRVVEEFGEEKDHMLRFGLKQQTYTETEIDPEGNKKKVKKTVLVAMEPAKEFGLSMYARVFDNTNPNWTSDPMLNGAFLTAQQNFINDKLIITRHVFLNDVYERLGFEPTPQGQLVGWVLTDDPNRMKKEKRDGYISFGLESPKHVYDNGFIRDDADAIWLDFNVDGVIFNLI